MEVPLELLRNHFDMESGGRGAFKALAGPQVLRGDGHHDVEDDEKTERNEFDAPGGGRRWLAARTQKQPDEKNVREQEAGRHRRDVPAHQPIDGNTVGGGVWRHPPVAQPECEVHSAAQHCGSALPVRRVLAPRARSFASRTMSTK